jgi:hypothetical protein
MTTAKIIIECAPYLFGLFMVSILFVFAVPIQTSQWLSKGLHNKRHRKVF